LLHHSQMFIYVGKILSSCWIIQKLCFLAWTQRAPKKHIKIRRRIAQDRWKWRKGKKIAIKEITFFFTFAI
jgi:hypothetical protein